MPCPRTPLALAADFGYDFSTLLRFILHSVPILVLFLAVFGLVVGHVDFGPVGTLTVIGPGSAPAQIVLATWLLEAFGLIVLFLLIEGRSRLWWLDGLLTAWVAWIFRGPLLVVTIVVAAGRAQQPWWRMALGWWVLYTVCGLTLAVLRRLQTRARERASLKSTEPFYLQTIQPAEAPPAEPTDRSPTEPMDAETPASEEH